MNRKSKTVETNLQTIMKAIRAFSSTKEDEDMLRIINKEVVGRINNIIRARRAQEMSKAYETFQEGDKVKWFSKKRRYSGWIRGIVVGFTSKGIKVDVEDPLRGLVHWTVYPGFLQHDEEKKTLKRK
jgi:ribosomal protein L21E